jgi:hypothetical protein
MGFYDGFAELGRKLRQRAHTRILKKPKCVRFKCPHCTCEFETDLSECTLSNNTVLREACEQTSTTFWSECPVCNAECSSWELR